MSIHSHYIIDIPEYALVYILKLLPKSSILRLRITNKSLNKIIENIYKIEEQYNLLCNTADFIFYLIKENKTNVDMNKVYCPVCNKNLLHKCDCCLKCEERICRIICHKCPKMRENCVNIKIHHEISSDSDEYYDSDNEGDYINNGDDYEEFDNDDYLIEYD